MTDTHRLVAAVLANLPVHPEDGDTLTGWERSKVRSMRSGGVMAPIREAMYGPPEPLARTITVAVLRELAEEFGEEHEGDIADKIRWKVEDIEAAVRG